MRVKVSFQGTTDCVKISWVSLPLEVSPKGENGIVEKVK
jgi:hypothetical protein